MLLALTALLVHTPSISAHPGCNNPNHTVTRPVFVYSLKQNFQVEPCCASLLNSCAKQKPNCTIAQRLIRFIDWMDSTGGRFTEERMEEALKQRYATFTDTKRHSIDLKGWPVVGDRNAPVTVVMYFSGTCPMCKTNFRDLHREVTRGQLRGRVNIVCKPFGAGMSNRALTAAHEAGRFSDFMLELGNVQARIDEEVILSVADMMLFDRQAFRTLMGKPELVERAERSSSEAERNGVTHVPTYFIEGRRYDSVLDWQWIVDAIEYMIETKK